jgi:hypothetical protein
VAGRAESALIRQELAVTESYVNVIWKKSSRSAENGGCVEVGELSDGNVCVRDSKNVRHGSAILEFYREEWENFLGGVRAGSFDPS